MVDIKKLQKIAEKTEQELEKKNSWIKRYAEHAKEINKQKNPNGKAGKNKLDNYKLLRKKFKERAPLFVYSNISQAKGASSNRIEYSIRYRGESIGALAINIRKNAVLFKPIIKHIEDFLDDTSFLNMTKDELKTGIPWSDRRVQRLHNEFLNNDKKRKKIIRGSGKCKDNEEHCIESALLTELSKRIKEDKKTGEKKLLPFIQPVKLAESRFQLTTPLGASKGKPECSKNGKGGGIDILCRTGRGGHSRINVIELKIKNEKIEQVLSQAIIYSVFLYKLLTTPSANNEIWWDLLISKEQFKRQASNLDKRPLIINAVIAMPFPKNGEQVNKDFLNENIFIDNGKGIIKLHYIFFKISDDDKIEMIESSLSKDKK